MAGLTQGQVAKRLRWHRPTVTEIEAGRRRVQAEELTVLAELYGVKTAWILGKTGSMRLARKPAWRLASWGS